MKIRLRNPRDFWAGIIFLVIGVATAVIARDYPMGNASRMGPGYFPFVLACILAVLGLIIALMSFAVDGPPIDPFAVRALTFILGSVVIFGLIAKILGIAISILILVVVSAFGGHEFKLKEVLIAGVILSAFSVATFIYGLKLPFPIWPEFLG